jgi:lipopolysaccharide export system permease protein
MSLSELLHPNPAVVPARDFGKLRVEAHKRLSAPLTAMSFALVALVSVLGGSFRRHGGMIRIISAVLIIVGLLAAELAFYNLAARAPGLLPLVWLDATAPGVVAALLLFIPRGVVRRRRARVFPVIAEAAAGR